MAQLSSSLRRAGTAIAATAALAGGMAGAATPAHAAPAGICSGIKHCTVAKSVDVTGDGVKDTVAVVPKKIKNGNPSRVQVRVRTGTGSLLTYTDKGLRWVGTKHLFRGAARLDGRRGAELVIGHAEGAHTVFYRVLTYRHHKLVMLRKPRLPKAAMDGYRDDTSLWVTDGSASSFEGIFRTRHHGKARVRLTTGVLDWNKNKFDTWVVTYRWNHGWHKISSDHRFRPPKKVAHFWGWHTKHLHGM